MFFLKSSKINVDYSKCIVYILSHVRAFFEDTISSVYSSESNVFDK